ncbi:nucleotidyltransferase domain-containing protein [Roseomonas genomospecies 6]|uniref:Nucleotidyltransferase domain-containing protein n=1 Tax=Roseomonas genomospecies 6 TaxID=214106 RepID=A0A9W7NMB1_9PROT|nr:nucleotidyltransferase domain-containing protein [Roseomonas genomospecies 6]KAA0682884.1 nucleotidyltransferase domain-containing protein [Roseomonas genomospecies 6]
MRLTTAEVTAIKQTAAEVFGPAVTVRLFGSRLDDARRGGDIDLFLEVEPAQANFRNECLFRHRLEDRIGEQKIDVVLHPQGRPPSPIAEIARDMGMTL